MSEEYKYLVHRHPAPLSCLDGKDKLDGAEGLLSSLEAQIHHERNEAPVQCNLSTWQAAKMSIQFHLVSQPPYFPKNHAVQKCHTLACLATPVTAQLIADIAEGLLWGPVRAAAGMKSRPAIPSATATRRLCIRGLISTSEFVPLLGTRIPHKTPGYGSLGVSHPG